MTPADLANGGIQLLIGFAMLGIASGKIRIAKTSEANAIKLKQMGWLFWAGGIGGVIMGVFKLFGFMR
jgi:hypothetical protein